jgi:hypothetical protein
VRQIKKANPNRHGLMVLDVDDDGVYWITPPHDPDFEEDPYDVGTNLQEATVAFDSEVQRLAKVPNWEAQAAYDDEHGTINGYSPFQFRDEY